MPFNLYRALYPGYPYPYPPGPYPGWPPAPPQAPPPLPVQPALPIAECTDRPSTSGHLSSNGDVNPYPTILEFVSKLKERYPVKNFEPMLDFCKKEEYETINKLSGYTIAQFEKPVGLKLATAQLVHERLQAEIKKARH